MATFLEAIATLLFLRLIYRWLKRLGGHKQTGSQTPPAAPVRAG
jgi:hypothetical protein